MINKTVKNPIETLEMLLKDEFQILEMSFEKYCITKEIITKYISEHNSSEEKD